MACLLLLALLQTAPAPAAAQDAPRPPGPPVPPTRMGTELLAQDPVVVVGRTVSSTNFGIGTAVVRLSVRERLMGRALPAGSEAVVFAYAGDFHAGDEGLVYLLPIGDGQRWRVLERVDGRDPDFAAKLAATRDTIELVGRPAALREDGAFVLVGRLLAAPDAWSRTYALRELRWMARHHPELFTPLRRATLARLAQISPYEDVRAGVEIVTMLLPTDDDP